MQKLPLKNLFISKLKIFPRKFRAFDNLFRDKLDFIYRFRVCETLTHRLVKLIMIQFPACKFVSRHLFTLTSKPWLRPMIKSLKVHHGESKYSDARWEIEFRWFWVDSGQKWIFRLFCFDFLENLKGNGNLHITNQEFLRSYLNF